MVRVARRDICSHRPTVPELGMGIGTKEATPDERMGRVSRRRRGARFLVVCLGAVQRDGGGRTSDPRHQPSRCHSGG